VDLLSGVVPPAQPADHGYGLWLARQLVSAVDVGSSPTGTHVRLHTRRP
jgi:anti-sigma regulatory factor (Ser/Thr protein kinase)